VAGILSKGTDVTCRGTVIASPAAIVAAVVAMSVAVPVGTAAAVLAVGKAVAARVNVAGSVDVTSAAADGVPVNVAVVLAPGVSTASFGMAVEVTGTGVAGCC